MQVIDRNKSIPVIGAYEATLGPKVTRFKEVHERLTSLSVACKQQVALSAAQIETLDAVTEIEARAERERRSVSAQVEHELARALGSRLTKQGT